MRSQTNRAITGNGLPTTSNLGPGINTIQDMQQSQTAVAPGPSGPNKTPSFDYLVVGGGGAGSPGVSTGPGTGYFSRGGGGAGGYNSGNVTTYLDGLTLSVTVGGGAPAFPASGVSSSITCPALGGSIIGYGGGSGNSTGNRPTGTTAGIQSTNAGSGAGGDPMAGWGRGLPGQGNDGGRSEISSSNQAGGGGGGAGGAGGNATYISLGSSSGGGGGGGATWLNGITYGGGGGGGSKGPTIGRSGGGGGGGGAGGAQTPGNTAGIAGSSNTGGGGGGSAAPSAGVGSGGSGIVIIRWPDTYDAANATTGSPTVSTSGGYRYYTFTGNGSLTF